MKKILALALALVMVFVLAACGTDASEPSADPNASASPAASVGPADVPDVEVSASLNFAPPEPTTALAAPSPPTYPITPV